MLPGVCACNTNNLDDGQVESIAFDIDYRAKVTRSEFETACKDLQLKFAKPIFDALSNAGLSLVGIRCL